MLARILGFDQISFTDQKSGEVIEGKKVFYEMLAESDEEPTAQFGNSCSSGFFKNCCPLSVGSAYGIIFKQKKTPEGVLFKPSGFYPIT